MSKTTKFLTYIILILMLIPLIGVCNQPQPVHAADEIKSISNGGKTLKADLVKDFVNAGKKYKILPSLLISQSFTETHWGEGQIGVKDNNWTGIKYVGSPTAAGVNVTKGTHATDDGGDYNHYSEVGDFIKDYSYLISDHTGGLYAVSGKSDFKAAVAGLFTAGGAKANYAGTPVTDYVPLVVSVRNAMNKDGYMDKLDKMALKDGKWDSTPLSGSEVENNTNGAESNKVDTQTHQSQVDDTFTVNGYGTVNGKTWDDIKIETPDAAQASQDIQGTQKQELSDWVSEYNSAATLSLIGIARITTQAVGFVLVMFAVAIVLAFAFDRVGVFDVSAVALLTNNKLETAYQSEDSNFLDKRVQGQSKRIVTKDVVIIVLLVLAISYLLFSGYIYMICYKLYYIAQIIVKFAGEHLAGINS